MDYTVKEWMEIWLETYVRQAVTKNTYECYCYAVKRAFKADPNLESTSLNDITELYFQNFINGLVELFSKSSIKHIVVAFGKAYKIALRNNLCKHNPISDIIVPRNAAVKIVRALTREEQHILEEALEDEQYGYVYKFLLYTGLRRNEFINLKWCDFDQHTNTIRIVESKTDAGERTIPLIPEACEIIHLHCHTSTSEYIFTRASGYPFTDSILKKNYVKLRTKTGINILTNHVLRHTFATRLVEKGVTPKALAALLGHTDEKFAMHYYVSTEENYLREQIMLLSNQDIDSVYLGKDTINIFLDSLIQIISGENNKQLIKFLHTMRNEYTKK